MFNTAHKVNLGFLKDFQNINPHAVIKETLLTTKELEICKNLLNDTLQNKPIIFCVDNDNLKDCLVALKIVTEIIKDTVISIKLEHWNYHPMRKELTLTHQTVFYKKDIDSTDDLSEKLIELVKESVSSTFRSLNDLLSK